MTGKALENISVLSVDDDPFALDVISQTLWKLGIHIVETTQTAEQALEFIKGDGYSFDVLICDLHMPETNGVEFLIDLAAVGYKGHFVILSGAIDQTIEMARDLANARGLNILGTLKKPVKAEEVQRLFEKVVS